MSTTTKDKLEDLRKIDLPFNVDEVTSQCHECVRKQIEKYKDQVDENGLVVGNRFLVACTGIPKEPVDLSLKSQVSDEVWGHLIASVDIVEWAKKYVKLENGTFWEARWYQEAVIRCSSKRKVLRISRRAGKTTLVCIEICYYLFTEPNTKIIVAGPQKTHTEEIITRVRAIIDAVPEFKAMRTRDVSSPNYEMQFSNGSRLRGYAAGTKGKGGGVSIRGQDADRIYCFPKGTLVSTSEFAEQPIETLTLQNTILGGNQDGIQIGEIKNLGVRKGTLITIPTALSTIKCTPDHPLFDGERDIEAKDAKEVIVSLYHKELTYGKEVIQARLLGFLYGDGWISGESVGFSGQKLDLEQIQTDLTFLGDKRHSVSTRICENKERGIKGEGSQFYSSYTYSLFKDCLPAGKKVFQPLRVPSKVMEGKEYLKSAFLSGLFSAESSGIKYQVNKKTPRPICLNMRSTKEKWIKNWIGDVCTLLEVFGIKYSVAFKYFKDGEVKDLTDNGDRYIGYISVNNSKENLQKYIDKIGFCYNAEKTALMNSHSLFLHYERIWDSDNWRKNRLIRAEVGTSAFIGEKLGLPKSTVKYHKNLYDELYSEPLLLPHEYIDKIRWKGNYVKLPIQKEGVRYSEELVDVYNLTSGASNRFFAGGMLTHNCEEMDFMDETAIVSAIFPILQTNPETTLVGFSTPSGHKTPFYNLCQKNPRYIEYHHTYKVLPHWKNVELERSQYTEERWDHEFLASFGSTESGVYKPELVKSAIRDYEYDTLVREPNWKYCIGTDWNEKYGTEISVLGFNPSSTLFTVAETIHVPRAEFTQLKGVEVLLDSIKKWRPEFVYLDAGNGSTNEELLRKLAKENRTESGDKEIAKLIKTLKKYDAGSSLSIRDTASGKQVKVPAKPFMVNASIRMFEQKKIIISATDTKLIDQLGNYVIDRFTPSKIPVYGMADAKVGDHRLDSLNLAIVAFQLELGELFSFKPATNVGFAPSPRKETEEKRNILPESQKESLPTERTLEFNLQNRGDSLPGRVDLADRNYYSRQSFDRDEEIVNLNRARHELYLKNTIARTRPKRTTF